MTEQRQARMHDLRIVGVVTHFADEEIEAQSQLAQDLPGSWRQSLVFDPSIPFPSRLSFPK